MKEDIQFDKVKGGYALIDLPMVFERAINEFKNIPNVNVGSTYCDNNNIIGLVVSVETKMDKSSPKVSETFVGVWFGERNHKKWKIKYYTINKFIEKFKVLEV